MARIGLNITVTGLSGKLIIQWSKATSPLVEEGRSDDFDFPYDAVYTINNLNRVVYIVRLYRSDDGIALSQLIKDWSIDASLVNVAIFKTYQYKTDRGDTEGTIGDGTYWLDPSAGDTQLIDERLDGITQDEMRVHEAGFGDKLNDEYQLLAGGGIELLGGKQFDADTAWFITVSTIDTVSLDPGTTASTRFAGVTILSANDDFDTTLYNHLIIANFAGSTGQITYPDLSLIPDDTHVTVNTHGGSQNYLIHQFDAGDNVKFNNQNVNVIYQAKNEVLSLYFHSGICYVEKYDGRAMYRGGVLLSYDSSLVSDTDAVLLANESTGELLESDYPGLYATVEALPSGTVPLGTGVGEWSYDSGGGVYPNKRYFGIQTTAPKKIRVPHLPGVSPKVGTTPGAYEKDTVYVDPVSGIKGVKITGTNTGTSFDNSAGEINNREGFTIQSDAGITETRVKSFIQIAYIIL